VSGGDKLTEPNRVGWRTRQGRNALSAPVMVSFLCLKAMAAKAWCAEHANFATGMTEITL
jgi:hypothetical protein